MALRTIREMGDRILHKISKEVKSLSKRDLYLIEDMVDTMYESEGVGLAAPQVGVLKRIVVIHGGVALLDESDPESDSCEESLEKEKTTVQEDESEELKELEEADPIILINPVITSKVGSQTGEEACLSVPGKWGDVTRPTKVTVKAFDVDMKEFELEGEGLLARAICHELDHLDGKLYVDLVEGGLRDNSERDEED